MIKRVFKILKFARNMSNNNNNNNNNKEDANQRAERVIRNHVMWSMGASFIPFPVADFLAVAAVQLDMVRSMCNVYDLDFKESEGKAIISALAGSGLSRLGANALIKLIPGVGSMIGGLSMSVVSGASTYAIGQVFKLHFSSGGTILDFDTNRFRKFYEEQFEKGKKVAEDIRNEEEQTRNNKQAENQDPPQKTPVDNTPPKQENPPKQNEPQPNTPPQKPNTDQPVDSSQVVQKLKELAELRDMGIITEEEFVQMKTQIIKNYK